mmetsp:Transcript_36885/g.98248  ORF Transcript_36885/g.98248 Transcript_36885/m.98248 type:complete len:218 (+) Transcript_36885:618-1271(+)
MVVNSSWVNPPLWSSSNCSKSLRRKVKGSWPGTATKAESSVLWRLPSKLTCVNSKSLIASDRELSYKRCSTPCCPALSVLPFPAADARITLTSSGTITTPSLSVSMASKARRSEPATGWPGADMKKEASSRSMELSLFESAALRIARAADLISRLNLGELSRAFKFSWVGLAKKAFSLKSPRNALTVTDTAEAAIKQIVRRVIVANCQGELRTTNTK